MTNSETNLPMAELQRMQDALLRLDEGVPQHGDAALAEQYDQHLQRVAEASATARWGDLAGEPHLSSWNVDDFAGAGYSLPPDLTLYLQHWRWCSAEWRGWVCTRVNAHTGRHAAGDGSVICAVWA